MLCQSTCFKCEISFFKDRNIRVLIKCFLIKGMFSARWNYQLCFLNKTMEKRSLLIFFPLPKNNSPFGQLKNAGYLSIIINKGVQEIILTPGIKGNKIPPPEKNHIIRDLSIKKWIFDLRKIDLKMLQFLRKR